MSQASQAVFDEAGVEGMEDEAGTLQRLAGELDCFHCLKQFSSSRLPKLLPCNHCLCSNCLGAMLQLKNQCPICQYVLPSESAEAYPNDRSLLRLAESIPEPGDTPTLCGECFESSPATRGCMDCQSFLCRLHVCTHSCGRLTYSHTTAPAADILVRFQISLDSCLCMKHFGISTCSLCQEDFCIPCGTHQSICAAGLGSKKKKKKKKPEGKAQSCEEGQQIKSAGGNEAAGPSERGSPSVSDGAQQVSAAYTKTLADTVELAAKLDENLEDNAECPVCLARFKSDVTERLVPRILPCDHLVCSGCLHVLLSDRAQRKCPECRAVLPLQRVSDYSKHLRLLRMLEKNDADEDESGLLCAECVDDRPGGFACVQCQAFLCRLHSCAHRRSRATHSHPLAISHALMQGSDQAAASCCPCRKHFGSLLRACPTCGAAFCAECSPAGHVHCAVAAQQLAAALDEGGASDEKGCQRSLMSARSATILSEPFKNAADKFAAKYASKFAAQDGEGYVDIKSFLEERLDMSKCDGDQIFALQVYLWFASDKPIQIGAEESFDMQLFRIPGDNVVGEPLLNYRAGNFKAAEAGLTELIDLMEQFSFFEELLRIICPDRPDLFPDVQEHAVSLPPHFKPKHPTDVLDEIWAFFHFFRHLMARLLDKWHGTVLAYAVRCTLRLRVDNTPGALADAKECVRQRPGWMRGLGLLARACEASGCAWGANAAMQHMCMGGGVVDEVEHDEWGRKVEPDSLWCQIELMQKKSTARYSQFSKELWACAVGIVRDIPNIPNLPNMGEMDGDKLVAQLMYLQFAKAEGVEQDACGKVGQMMKIKLDRVLGDHMVLCPLYNFLAGNYAEAEQELGHLIASFELFEAGARRDDFLQQLVEPTMQRLQRSFGRAAIMAKMVRCTARLQLGDGPGALADAQCCVASEPHWIRTICLLARAYGSCGMVHAAGLAGMHAQMLWQVIDRAATKRRYITDPEEDMKYCAEVLGVRFTNAKKGKRKLMKHDRKRQPPPPPKPAQAPTHAAFENINIFPEPMIMLMGMVKDANPANADISPASMQHILPDTTSLDWSDRGASVLPAGSLRLKKLQRLNINGNLISALHPMPLLTELWMESNALQAVPDSISALTNLSLLSMAQNRLVSIPATLPVHLPSLATLRLANNLLDVLPDSLSALTSLTLLDISKNRIAAASPCLQELSTLSSLVLTGNKPLIASKLPLPVWLLRKPGVIVEHRVRTRGQGRGEGSGSEEREGSEGCFVVPLCKEESTGGGGGVSISLPSCSDAVRLLDLSSAKGLDYIPECIAGYSALRKLRLSWLPEVTEWPAWLGNLATVQDLSLEGSGLRQLPEALRAMGGLTALNVSQNQLSQLPGWLGRCTRLLSLQARSNKIQSLPHELSSLGSLLRLELGANELSQVPPCISHLTRLRTLDLRRNALVGLPSWAELPVKGGIMNQKMERGRVPEHLGFTLSKEVLDLRWGWTPVAEVECLFCGSSPWKGMIFPLEEGMCEQKQMALLCRECEGSGHVRAPIRSVVSALLVEESGIMRGGVNG